MKKVLAIALTAVLALTFTCSAFAWSDNTVAFNDLPNGISAWMINSNGGNEGYGGDLRVTYTPSRNAANNASSDDPSNFNANSVVVLKDENDAHAKLVAPQWINSDQTYAGNASITADLKIDTVNGFAGFVLAYDASQAGTVSNVNSQCDYNYTEYAAASSDMKYVMNSGFGFTFLKDSTSKVRVFVRTNGGADVITYDIGTGLDLTEYHNFGFYTNSTNQAVFCIDSMIAATIDYTAGNAGTATIKNADGTVVASTTSSYISSGNGINIALTGEGTTVYMDNLVATANATAPTETFVVDEQAEEEIEEKDAEAETETDTTDDDAEEESNAGTGDSFAVVFMVVAVASMALVLLKKKVF